MNREKLIEYIREVYDTEGDCPWTDDDSLVFRHAENGKWFALLMTGIPAAKFGEKGGDAYDVVNLKCDPSAIGALGGEGVFPAYHMNKTHWVSVRLGRGGADDGLLKTLLDASFYLTFPKTLGKGKR